MLGFWFIREYTANLSAGHSSALGFTGDLYVDFGKYSLLFVFLLGRVLKIGEAIQSMLFKTKGYNIIIGAMIFPYVFFFVRSPVTATMNFIGILFFCFILKKIIFSNSKVITSNQK